MSYGHAVLGESPELVREAIEWGKDEQQRIEKNNKAREIIWKDLEPMLREKERKIKERNSES